MSREEWETLLLERVERCRSEFEKIRTEYRLIDGVSLDAAGTADGNLACSHIERVGEEFRQALGAYQSALHEFTQFIAKGKLPDPTQT